MFAEVGTPVAELFTPTSFYSHNRHVRRHIMSKKHHGGPAPVPPGNRPNAGPANAPGTNAEQLPQDAENGAPFNDQDEKRRLGGFETAGEHSIQQPSRLNDGETHSK
jgi:hypothetical protein